MEKTVCDRKIDGNLIFINKQVYLDYKSMVHTYNIDS